MQENPKNKILSVSRKSKTSLKKICEKNKQGLVKAPVSKYLIENSWGQSSIGDENLVMTKKYLEEYVYIIAVNKKFVPDKIRRLEKQPPKRLNLWDPFGYLLF